MTENTGDLLSSAPAPPAFDAETYWSKRVYKKWKVSIIKRRGVSKKAVQYDTLYVRARTADIALKTALANTSLTGNLAGHARLAAPWDLGCFDTIS